MTNTTLTRPANSTKIAMKCGGATFFLFTASNGRPAVTFYRGRSKKAKCYGFRCESQRGKWIERTIASIAERKAETAKRRKQANRAHNLESGLILYTSWGYEQTNTEFYVVTGTPSKCFVEIQQIEAPLENGEVDFMSGTRVPNPEKTIGQPFKRKVDMSGSRPSIRINDCVTAWVWDGKGKSVSWYH